MIASCQISKLFRGETFEDVRGKIASLNHFPFDGVGRVYFLHHPDTSVVRSWNRHRFEKKWFYCVTGAFTLALVKIDDWETPSKNLNPMFYPLSIASECQIMGVPEDYASGMKTDEQNPILMFFSSKNYEEALAAEDSYRYNKDYWFSWESFDGSKA